MIKLLSYVLILMVVLSSTATASDPVKGRVVNVMTGDILIVSVDHRAEVVHLYGVECPERGEAGWLKVRNYTEQLVLYKQIVLEPVGSQRAGTIHIKSARSWNLDCAVSNARLLSYQARAVSEKAPLPSTWQPECRRRG
jgi:hypothetical protein